MEHLFIFLRGIIALLRNEVVMRQTNAGRSKLFSILIWNYMDIVCTGVKIKYKEMIYFFKIKELVELNLIDIHYSLLMYLDQNM